MFTDEEERPCGLLSRLLTTPLKHSEKHSAGQQTEACPGKRFHDLHWFCLLVARESRMIPSRTRCYLLSVIM